MHSGSPIAIVMKREWRLKQLCSNMLVDPEILAMAERPTMALGTRAGFDIMKYLRMHKRNNSSVYVVSWLQ